MDIDFKIIKSKQSLMERLKQIFNFPNYFGYNFDALEECLNDYCKNNYKLTIKNINKINPELKDDFIKLLEILGTFNTEHKNKITVLVC